MKSEERRVGAAADSARAADNRAFSYNTTVNLRIGWILVGGEVCFRPHTLRSMPYASLLVGQCGNQLGSATLEELAANCDADLSRWVFLRKNNVLFVNFAQFFPRVALGLDRCCHCSLSSSAVHHCP